MSLEKFIEELKSDNLIEAFSIIKADLTERTNVLKEEKRFEVAEKFNLSRIVEKEEKEMTDEEKEKLAAEEAADKGK